MNKLKNIVILGAGAVGVLPAEKLLRTAGISLVCAADTSRVARYRRDGIFFNGEKLPLTFATPDELAKLPPADLIIAATKTPSLAEALENVVPATAENTIFLPLLNGITAHEVISAKFPDNTVLRGYFLGHASVRQYNRICHDGVGTFYCGGNVSAIGAVKELFTAAGINMDVPQDMDSAIWKKFVLNVGINQTQAYFMADYGMVQNSPEMLEFCRQLMNEALMVAEKEQISGTETMIDDAMQVIMSMPGNVKTSMLQDLIARRPSELDAFAGTICRKAEKYGINVPYNRKVLEKLSSSDLL